MCFLRNKVIADGVKEKAPFRYSMKDAFKEKSNIEIISNTSAIVEGCCGVLEYSDKIIRVGFREFSVAFLGRRLKLKYISPTSLVVEGFFTGIEFSMG